METRILPSYKRPAITVSPDDLREFLLAHHTVQLMLLQGFDPDPRPSLSLTVDGEKVTAYDPVPFGSNALLVVLPRQTLVFVLLKGDDNNAWHLHDTILTAHDDLDNVTSHEEVEIFVKLMG